VDFLPEFGMIAVNRRNDDEAIAPEPQPGIQGQGCACRDEGLEDADSTGAAIRCASQPDQAVEGSIGGRGCRCFWRDESGGQPSIDVKTLHAKIGQLTLENDF
jgi:hypothetical protein